MLLFHTPQAETRHHKQVSLFDTVIMLRLPAAQDGLGDISPFCSCTGRSRPLDCPGCGEHFAAAGGLIDHIEKNRCKKIKNNDYETRREEKLAFARELQRRHHGERPNLPNDDLSVASLSLAETTVSRQGAYNFTSHLSNARGVSPGTPSLSALRPTAESTVRPNPVTFAVKEVEFPRLAGKQPDQFGEDQNAGDTAQARSMWEQKNNLFPGAPAPVRPTPEQLEAHQQQSPNKQTAWPEHDPRNPEWRPMDYFVSYINKYKCPHERCG